jgi:hypothetical protein
MSNRVRGAVEPAKRDNRKAQVPNPKQSRRDETKKAPNSAFGAFLILHFPLAWDSQLEL